MPRRDKDTIVLNKDDVVKSSIHNYLYYSAMTKFKLLTIYDAIGYLGELDKIKGIISYLKKGKELSPRQVVRLYSFVTETEMDVMFKTNTEEEVKHKYNEIYWRFSK